MGGSAFFLGCQSMAVQMLLMRELLAAFSGNELTIGVAFGIWFGAIALGALAGRGAARCASSPALRVIVAAVLLILALLPPLMLAGLIQARAVMGVAAYETLPFGRWVRLLVLLLGPYGLGQGVVFPALCRLASEGRRQGVGRIVSLESLGCLLGGLGFGAAVLAGMRPLAMALGTAALGLVAVAAAMRRRGARAAAVAAAFVGIAAAASGIPAAWEDRIESARWALAAGGRPAPIRRLESPYSRLTLVALDGQAALYANSQPLFLFPDPVVAEPLMHRVLLRHPDPRAVLVIGGNPADLGRAALVHPGCTVTAVEADARIWQLTADASGFPGPREHERFRLVTADPVWYVRRAPEAAYDLILLLPPQPETVGMNRFYTLEFYREIRRLLKPGGLFWTTVEATEQVQAETGWLAASVYRTLTACFPFVEVTSGAQIGFFASVREGIPMERAALAAAAEARGIRSAYFQPSDFWADDADDPVKRQRLRDALESIPVAANTLRHPVTHTFMMMRWNRFSGSRLGRVLWRLAEWDGARMAEGLLMGLTGAALLLGFGLCVLRGRRRERVVRSTLRLAVAVAGFSVMAFELILIFLAQALFGYVYQRLAFIVSLFMAGLALGAFWVRRHENADSRAAWGLTVGACSGLVMLGVGLPLGLNGGWESRVAAEAVLHGCMMAAGVAGGILFPMVNRLLRARGEGLTEAAGESLAADNLGAAVGSVAAGVVLIPVLGVAMTCFVLAVANTYLALVLAILRWSDGA